ncbi:MAG TPA: ankyrin repeat domain-containing protein, partial [Gemmataceae bacterium]|nr:ankyrin repeat domain-containing protein [Gemmataceae bacterium]
MRTRMFLPAMSLAMCLLLAGPQPASANDALWAAARRGDTKAIEVLLAKGVDVNSRTSYGATALWFAAYKGRLDVVKLLLRHKADPNVRDTVWGETPLTMAAGDGKAAIVRVLLEAGAQGADAVLLAAASQGQTDIIRAVLDKGKPTPAALNAALVIVPAKQHQIVNMLTKAGAKQPASVNGQTATNPFAGTFESPNGLRVSVAAKAGLLIVKQGNQVWQVLPAETGPVFHPIGAAQTTFTFEQKSGRAIAFRVKDGALESRYERVTGKATSTGPARPRADETPAVVLHPRNWPSFRGAHASGVADGQAPPTVWDPKMGRGIRWKTPIPGLAHSSPIVWGDKVFVTTAVSSDKKTEFRPGLYGAGTSARDVSRHRWQVYCLDKHTGKILWQRTACEGVPKLKRHIKSSHANPTPATDGKHLIVWFASQGLYCYALDGKLLWKRDLGLIDVGAFNDPDLQWGAATSPIIDHNRVIMQCDRHKDSFIAAYDIDTGRPLWRTPRDEFPTWSTPTVLEHAGRREVITNGARYIRGYDTDTGKELWRLGPNSEIPVPAP